MTYGEDMPVSRSKMGLKLLCVCGIMLYIFEGFIERVKRCEM